jgi:hypothetical protein
MSDEKKAQQSVEGVDQDRSPETSTPAAGPHAQPGLTDDSKTPGAGALPDADEKSVDPGAG